MCSTWGACWLAVGQVTAYARVHSTATAGEYLAALKRCEPRGAADKGELKVGGKVKVHSLKKAGEHNGKHGVLLGYDGEAGRWGVELDGEGEAFPYTSACSVDGCVVE